MTFSCNQENEDLFPSEDLTRLNNDKNVDVKVFENIEEFNNTLDLFSSFTGNSDFENWSNKQSYKSLYNSDNISSEERDHIPFTFLFILNGNKEFWIGNKLINYIDGAIYENSFDSYGNLTEKKVFVTFERTILKQGETQQRIATTNGVTVSADGGTYKEWEQFNRQTYRVGCGTPFDKNLTYRLVHYLVAETLVVGGVTHSSLFFKLRMSQLRSNGSWWYNNTSTERLYDLNLSGNCKFKFQTGTPLTSQISININDNNYCSNTLKGTKEYFLGQYNHTTSNPNLSLFYWDVHLSGGVFHKVNGDTNEVDETISW